MHAFPCQRKYSHRRFMYFLLRNQFPIACDLIRLIGNFHRKSTCFSNKFVWLIVRFCHFQMSSGRCISIPKAMYRRNAPFSSSRVCTQSVAQSSSSSRPLTFLTVHGRLSYSHTRMVDDRRDRAIIINLASRSHSKHWAANRGVWKSCVDRQSRRCMQSCCENTQILYSLSECHIAFFVLFLSILACCYCRVLVIAKNIVYRIENATVQD